MNIVVFGAGAIGSLYGTLLSKKNSVTLIGRPNHVNAIKKNGLTLEGLTRLNVKIPAEINIKNLKKSPDLLILTVKSFDTSSAVEEINKLISKDTTVLSLQNGLDNIEKMEVNINRNQIIAGITTQGAYVTKPGFVRHTGTGNTIIGELNGVGTPRLKRILDLFNDVNINTNFSNNIMREIWIKAIINSSINPLTTIFQCKNGYLLENPILEKIVEYVCKESTRIANKNGFQIHSNFTNEKTKEVIKSTAENFSSMVQSYRKNQKTEIQSINGKLVSYGKKCNVDTSLNNILLNYMRLQLA